MSIDTLQFCPNMKSDLSCISLMIYPAFPLNSDDTLLVKRGITHLALLCIHCNKSFLALSCIHG